MYGGYEKLSASVREAFDGVLCLGTPVDRVGAGFAVAGTAVEPYTHGAMATPGTNYYQMWYRNQPAAFCTPTPGP